MSPPRIVHTTDLTGDDAAAFVHAASIAAASGARLITVHGSAGAVEPARLPDAAPLAARWDRPIDHQRLCHQCCDDVADTVIDAIRGLAPAMVVAGTHARHGLATLFAGSVAEAVARNVAVPTLVVPNGVTGFVDPATGAIDLRRVLVPVGGDAEEQAGLAGARAFAGMVGAAAVIQELHVTGGPVVHEILRDAAAHQACLIVMATRGHDSVGDALRGSQTERVVREAGCPVLVVPMPGSV